MPSRRTQKVTTCSAFAGNAPTARHNRVLGIKSPTGKPTGKPGMSDLCGHLFGGAVAVESLDQYKGLWWWLRHLDGECLLERGKIQGTAYSLCSSGFLGETPGV